MKHRAIISAAAMGLLAAACLPAVNWADEGDDPFSAKILAEHEKQLKKQEERLGIQVEEVRVHAEFAAKEAHKAAEKARFKIFRDTGNPRYLTEINGQAAKYRDADNEEDKSTAMKNLNEVVDKCFEDDMKVREQELASIEERLNKLRAQLNRRRAKKQEIVDLQVKVAVNEAEGLGFYSEAKGDVFKFRVPAPVVTDFANPWEAPATWQTITPPPSADAAPVPTAAPAPPTPLPTDPHAIHFDVKERVIIEPTKAPSTYLMPNPAEPQPAEAHVATSGLRSVVVDSPAQIGIERQPLGPGAEGDAVRLLQYELNERVEPSPGIAVDGDFGPETEEAVKAFQNQQGLEVTGIVDEATRKELERRVRKPAKK